MRSLLAISLLASTLAAADWSAFRSAPFTVYTNAGDKEAQAVLAQLLQLQHTLGAPFGRPLDPVFPVAVVLRKNDAAVRDWQLSRDSLLAAAPSARTLPPALLAALARRLMAENTLPFDAEVEAGLATLFSTLEVEGPRVRVGAPPPPGDRDLAWARMHLLFTDERYSGRVRVLLANLAKGIAPAAAWSNSMPVSAAEITAQAKAHLAAGQFASAPLNGKPLARDRFYEEKLNPAEAALLEADLAFTADAYRRLTQAHPDLPQAKDGLAIFTKDPALLGPDSGARTLAAPNTLEWLEKAEKKNPRWSEPALRMAALETEPVRQAQRLRHAAQLALRDVALWRQAAQRFEQAEQPGEATKCWLAAEKATSDPAERASLRAARLAADDQRVAAEFAARRAAEEKERQDLERLRQESLRGIREAEARANAGKAPLAPGQKVEEWWNGPKGDTKLHGRLERVDCVGGLLRLQVRGDDKKLTPLMIRDLTKVALIGDSSISLQCGPQKPVRTVLVEYLAKGAAVTSVTFENAQ